MFLYIMHILNNYDDVSLNIIAWGKILSQTLQLTCILRQINEDGNKRTFNDDREIGKKPGTRGQIIQSVSRPRVDVQCTYKFKTLII